MKYYNLLLFLLPWLIISCSDSKIEPEKTKMIEKSLLIKSEEYVSPDLGNPQIYTKTYEYTYDSLLNEVQMVGTDSRNPNLYILKTINTYNEKSQLIRQDRENNVQVSLLNTYKYHDNGELREKISYGIGGIIALISSYDTQGQLEEEYWPSDIVKPVYKSYYYNEEGQLVRRSETLGGVPQTLIQNTFNSKGQKTKYEHYIYYYDKEEVIEYTYNDKDRLVYEKQTLFEFNRTAITEYNYEYDDLLNKVYYTRTLKGSSDRTGIKTYDDNGNLLSYEKSSSRNFYYPFELYEYDINGNLILYTEYHHQYSNSTLEPSVIKKQLEYDSHGNTLRISNFNSNGKKTYELKKEYKIIETEIAL